MLARIFATSACIVLFVSILPGCRTGNPLLWGSSSKTDVEQEQLAMADTMAELKQQQEYDPPVPAPLNSDAVDISPTANAAETSQFVLSDTSDAANEFLPTENSRIAIASHAEPEGSSATGIAAVPTQLASAARKTLDVFGLGGASSRGADSSLASEIENFERFPFAFKLPTVAGEMVDSSKVGGQLLVVDIWATWCGPCKKAIPEFIELQNEFAPHGVEVVGITCDSDDPADAAETTRKAYNIGEKLGVNYALLVDDGTTKPQIPGFRSYPTTLFVTADGQVRYMVVGVQPKARMAEIIKTILQI